MNICYIYLYKSCKDQCILRFLWAICPVVSHVFWGWYILVWTRSNQYDLTPRTHLYLLAVRVMNPHHLSRFNQLCTEALSCCRLIVWKHWHRKSSFLYYCYFRCFQYFVLNRVLTFWPYELKNIRGKKQCSLSLFLHALANLVKLILKHGLTNYVNKTFFASPL